MDASITSLVSALGVPLIIYVGAEIVKRSTSIGQVRVEDRSKLTAQLSDELAKAYERLNACDESRRAQDQRIYKLEFRAAQIGAEARLLHGIADEYVGEHPPSSPTKLQNDAVRVQRIAARLEELARRIEDKDDDEPVTGIGGPK